MHALIGGDERAQHFGIEAAVGMRYISPGHAEHARIAFQVAGGQFRQFFVKAGGKVVANFAKLFLNDVKVIDQPFRCRGDGEVLLNRLGSGTVIFQQRAAVFGYARYKRTAAIGIRRNSLSSGQAFGMLFQTLDTEKLCANGLFGFSDNGLGLRNAGHGFPRGERATQACVINALEYNAICERGTIMRDGGNGAGRCHRLTDEEIN